MSTAIAALDASARERGDGFIGPNAITRVGEALTRFGGAGVADRVFEAAGLLAYRREPPTEMVPEGDVARLHATLFRLLPEPDARAVAREAGRLTGEYLLANRIPRLAQRLLRLLPSTLAAHLLCRAIARHAWTFAGSGAFRAIPGRPTVLTLTGSRVSRALQTREPACDYFAATFERIFADLVSPRVRVTETECEAAGGRRCRFIVSW